MSCPYPHKRPSRQADVVARLLPMLATTGSLPPDDGAWMFEAKWDGVRALVHCDDGRVSA